MRNLLNPKLFRKFFILAVMVTGLLIVSSNRQVAAGFCCDGCIATFSDCNAFCESEFIKPDQRIACLNSCHTDFLSCSSSCGWPGGCIIQ
jgi:hypothetical protein